MGGCPAHRVHVLGHKRVGRAWVVATGTAAAAVQACMHASRHAHAQARTHACTHASTYTRTQAHGWAHHTRSPALLPCPPLSAFSSPACKVQPPPLKAYLRLQPRQPLRQRVPEVRVGVVQVGRRAVVVACTSAAGACRTVGARALHPASAARASAWALRRCLLCCPSPHAAAHCCGHNPALISMPVPMPQERGGPRVNL